MLNPIKTNMVVLRYRGKRLEHGTIIVATLLLLVVSVLNIYLGFDYRRKIFQYEQKIEELKVEQAAFKKDSRKNAVDLNEEDIESIRKQIVRVNRIIAEDVFPWSPLLDSLEESIPDEITLSKLTTKNQFRDINLNGRSTSVDAVTLYLENLERSALYQSVNLANLNLNRSERVMFNITGRIDMKTLLPPSQYGELWKIWR